MLLGCEEGGTPAMEVLYQQMYKMKALDARKRVIKTWKETKSIRKTARWMG